jgi:uncharacterized protein with NRDE domain
MCTVLVAWHWRADVPYWLVAANRDELRARPSEPPGLLVSEPALWGGRDRLAGGTWLAVDPVGGRACAVTNRHPGGRLPQRDDTRRSRGVLPTEVLLGGNDHTAAEVLEQLPASGYNPVNVLYLSHDVATWVGLDDEVGRRSTNLEPGIHVLTEQDPDDVASEKTQRLLEAARAAAAQAADADDLLARFAAILRSHDRGPTGQPQGAACIHETVFGTVSSALINAGPGEVSFAHAEGQPCVTAYAPVLEHRR